MKKIKKIKRSTLISKPDIMLCWRCDGVGCLDNAALIKCPLCHGTGKWIENHYIVIDNKNKIAFDTETGG